VVKINLKKRRISFFGGKNIQRFILMKLKFLCIKKNTTNSYLITTLKKKKKQQLCHYENKQD